MNIKNIIALLLLVLSTSSMAGILKERPELRNILVNHTIFLEGIELEPYIGRLCAITVGSGQALANTSCNLYPIEYINKKLKKAKLTLMTQTQYKGLKLLSKIAKAEGKQVYLKKVDYIFEYYSNSYLINSLGFSQEEITSLKSNPFHLKSIEEVVSLLNTDINFRFSEMEKNAKEKNIDLAILPNAIIAGSYDLYVRGMRGLVVGDKTKNINQALRTANKLEFAKQVYAYSNGDDLLQNHIRNGFIISELLPLMSIYEVAEFREFKENHEKGKTITKKLAKHLSKKSNHQIGKLEKAVQEVITL